MHNYQFALYYKKNERQYKTILDDFEIESNVILKYKGDKQQVEIPEGITTIGAKAFADSITLNIVKIPNTVKNIDHQAFYNCYGLLVVVLPYRHLTQFQNRLRLFYIAFRF